MYLNIIFHRLGIGHYDIRDLYEVTVDQFVATLTFLRQRLSALNRSFDDYRLYFDDGDDSFMISALPHIMDRELSNCVLAITTDNIGKNGFLSKNDLVSLQKKGIQIASHSVSHPALAFYRDQVIQPTPAGGRFQSAPFGHTKILTAQEVLYQLQESKRILEEIVGSVSEFVLPHGCYNQDVINLNQVHGLYKVISTCDNYLDDGRNLRPRILTRSDMSIMELHVLVNGLSPQP